ncbi:retrotransposon protein, putative, ty1-copia subclass [Tanacetum coccineum]
MYDASRRSICPSSIPDQRHRSCVVSFSRLLDLGFVHTVTSNGISVSSNGIFYFSAISVNGVFEIDMNDNVSKYNNNSIFSINKKRKLDLNSSYLWHYRLAHIGKTRMQKLQREGLLESINDESYDKCESCISGKMTKKPFNNNIERATDLLEVELQLGKKIKALRSDRGGEYLSQEFKEYLGRDLISQEFSGRDYDLEDDHMDTLPSENTSEIPVEPESLGPPPELIPVRDLGEPANYKAAMLDPDKVIWQVGASGYSKKTDMDGQVHTYKARLVAKGHTQTYGIDYEETFSPVADIRAIRILIAIAAYYDYEIWQMDVKTAFLNGRLDEDIYMEQPEGYVNPRYPNRVCKLQRSIYGLKQASRQWNKRFDEEIKKFGFTQNRDEPCVYRKASGSNVVFLILYVDDILIMGNNIPRLKEVKDYLGKCFSMKDLGEAAYILGIKIYRDRSKRLIGLSQSAYIDKILKKFNMHNSKKGYLPMEVKHELSNEMCASTPEEVAYMKKVPYASAVGSILYAVRCTRPDVAFAQNLVSRYQQNLGKLHWAVVKHILKYLRNTRDMFLVYGGKPDTELNVIGFCDASWQCDKDDTKSQTGYVFVVNGGAVV